jgi:hypothetical protein
MPFLTTIINHISGDPAEAESHRIGRGYFDPSRRFHLAIVLLTAFLSCAGYAWIVRRCYVNKHIAVRTTNIFHHLPPAVPRIADQPHATATDPALLLAHLQQLGLYTDDRLSTARKKPSFQFIADLMLNEPDKRRFDSPSVPTVYWIARLTRARPLTADGHAEGPGTVYDPSTLALLGSPSAAQMDLISAVIAGYPNTLGAWNRFIDSHASASGGGAAATEPADVDETRRALIDLVKPNRGAFGGLDGLFRGFDLSVAATILDPHSLIATLWRANGVNKEYLEAELLADDKRKAELGEGPIARPKKMTRADLLEVEEVLAAMISQIQSSPAVKEADWWMSLARGWPQLLMLAVTLWTLGILAGRWFVRSRNERIAHDVMYNLIVFDRLRSGPDRTQRIAEDISGYLEAFKSLANPSLPRLMLETCRDLLRSGAGVDVLRNIAADVRGSNASSRWLLTWLGRALPALGFLGTVIGISLGLGDADSIVRARTPIAQAAAIQAVSANLGVAFLTTLVALLFGLFLTFLNDLQTYRERRVVVKLEQVMIDLIDPARTPAVPGVRIQRVVTRGDPRDEIRRSYEKRLVVLKGRRTVLIWIVLLVLWTILMAFNGSFMSRSTLWWYASEAIHNPSWKTIRPVVPTMILMLLLCLTAGAFVRRFTRLAEAKAIRQALRQLKDL